MNGPDRLSPRQLLLTELLAAPAARSAANDPNRGLLAGIVAGQATGHGCLPADLGLGVASFAHIRHEYFPGVDLPAVERQAPALPEHDELLGLLLGERAREFRSEALIATIVATACAGHDHLWQDLGLGSRDELTRLMWINFPSLARANSGDMKWKKFLYRLLCSREGIYVCPAPSCGVCTDFAQCFGPEN
ncbi:MAG TPA: nitrogen fixation protein NifQ [Azonexus sp.]